MLKIYISIKNNSETKKEEYHGWGNTEWEGLFRDEAPTLTDNFDNTYRRPDWAGLLKVKGQISSTSLYPEKTVNDIIVFAVPVEKAEYLRLTLPAKAFGGKDVLRFQIPMSIVGQR